MLQEVNIGYARLDGTMGREERAAAMEDLRKKATTEVLLVSLRAGGVGLNLTAATRCYLIDPYWWVPRVGALVRRNATANHPPRPAGTPRWRIKPWTGS